MIAMTITSYAMPIMRGRLNGNSLKAQSVEKLGFWLMVIGMLGITFALTAAGVIQIMLQRWDDSNALSFMATQIELIPVYQVRLVFGFIFTAGLVAYFTSFFVGGELPGETEKVA
jgi:nitric oxide reductase subunit B